MLMACARSQFGVNTMLSLSQEKVKFIIIITALGMRLTQLEVEPELGIGGT